MVNILTLEEAARYLKVAPITLYRKARRGEVPAAKLGKSWRFHREQLEEWIKESASSPRRISRIEHATFRHLSTRETKLVLQFIEILQSRYPRFLEGVTLYGSRARGDFKDYSDIDLLIVLKDDAGTIKKEISDMTNRFNLDNDVRLQTLCASKREWADPSFRTFLLFEKIRREGIPFYG